MAGQTLTDVINDNMAVIRSIFLFLILLAMLKIFLVVYNHSTWSGLDGISPGVYNPN